jgi:hypothetical protein
VKDGSQFVADLNRSRSAVNKFAAMLRRLGVSAWMPPEEVRPSEETRHEYADDGDLMVQLRVEHKVRTNLAFTCREDYPYDTVIVDEKYKEDAKQNRRPFVYVIENKDGTCAAVVHWSTRPFWKVETRQDPIQKRACQFYTVDKSRVRFCKPEDVF